MVISDTISHFTLHNGGSGPAGKCHSQKTIFEKRNQNTVKEKDEEEVEKSIHRWVIKDLYRD